MIIVIALQAEQFHKGAQKVLDFLSETERQIRYKGAIPDEETVILQQLEDHKASIIYCRDVYFLYGFLHKVHFVFIFIFIFVQQKFEDSLLQKETELRGTLNVGTEIMNHCHPDAVTIMKHWLSVLRARWEEVVLSNVHCIAALIGRIFLSIWLVSYYVLFS